MRWRAIWLGILICSTAGCLNDRPAKSTSLIDRVRGMGGPTGPDAVFIEYALIERPAGSAGINREAWANVDEQVLASDKRALLSENGLRVGIVGGLLPSEIEAMIANPKSAIGHRQRRLYANNAAVLPMNGPVPVAEYQMLASLDGKPATLKFEQAQFSLNITPSFAADGRIKVKSCPEIEFNDRKSWLPTGAAGSAWAGNKPAEKPESLAWEVSLSAREFAIVGSHHERGNWIGNQIFTGTVGHDKVQRLLIVRAGKLAATEDGSTAPLAAPTKDGVVPLAAQASTSAVRGQRP